VSREKIKNFWTDRAKTTDVLRSESRVNFQKDSGTIDSYLKAETDVMNNELQLDRNDIVVDLGAGNGRWSFFIAPKVKKVTAVEYIEAFTDEIKLQIKELKQHNVEVISSSSEEFNRSKYADVVFVSGLFIYLDREQYERTIKNIADTCKADGLLFMREPISVLENEFIVDKFSEELNTHYCSIYRTAAQHIEALERHGFILEKYAPFFEDGSVHNNRVETRLFYFVFKRNGQG